MQPQYAPISRQIGGVNVWRLLIKRFNQVRLEMELKEIQIQLLTARCGYNSCWRALIMASVEFCWVECVCKPFDYAPHTHTHTHRYIVSVSVFSVCIEGSLLKNSIIEIANNNRLKVTRLRNVGNVFYTLCLPLPAIPLLTSLPPALAACLSFCYEYVSSLCWLHNNWITFSYI